ncbi:unnamed protein product [Trichogramma brassicae]|uniref:Uncharacterized protein n=1 Tax=Trichogramma brassicae TaxID=86971 RepID=A0A6H5HY56_9HYME|nr:unnamed protein product [Trichogramma brassicae]
MKIFFAINDEASKTVKVDAKNRQGNTPLHLAIIYGKKKLAELLLKRGANPNLTNNDEMTPLHSICMKDENSDDLTTWLFEISKYRKLQVNAQDKRGQTPLHLALKNRYVKMAKLLMSRGADPNWPDKDGLTPLHLICKRQDDDDELVQRFFDVDHEFNQLVQVNARDKWGNPPLHWALENGHLNIIQLLLRRGADANLANLKGLTPLHIICLKKDDDDDLVSRFFDWVNKVNQIVQVNAQDQWGNTPLHWALENKHLNVVQLLLRQGADANLPNLKGLTLLHIICLKKDDDDHLVKRFFDWVNKINQVVQVNAQDKSGNSPLHWALDKKHVKIAEWLLKNSHADPNLANAAGLTPLQIICINKVYDDIYDDDFVELLFKISEERNQTVQVNIRFEFGNTLLHLAVCKGKLKMAGLLLRRGADPNLTNEKGLTPLHIISQECDDDGEFLETFFAINDKVGRTVLVDIQNSKGDTALHLALTSDNKKAAELLLRRGANPNVANKEKSTPLHVVCQKKDDEEDLVKMLFELSHEKHHPLDFNAKNEIFFSPLMYALFNGHKKVAELLVTRCNSLSVIDAEGSTPLHDICKYDFNDQDLVICLFKIIIEQDRTIQIDTQDRFGITLLHLAFDSHHENLAALLLRNGANPNIANASGETPLHRICSRDYDDDVFDAAKMLFDISDEKQKTILVDAQDKQGWTPLHSAVARMHARLIKLLLRRGANPNIANAKGETPLHHICSRDYDDDVFDAAKMLFDISDEKQKTILVDAQDNRGWTPLHSAATMGHAHLIKLLLERGANPNSTNKDGETPLHKICELCENGLIEGEVKMCMDSFHEVKQRVQADVRDKKGNTPLHRALDRGYQNWIEWLLRIGADPNCANKDGETALHIIIRNTALYKLFDEESVEKFFKIIDDEQLTVQIDVKDNSGRTPLQCAVANLLPEVVGVLLDRGADLSNFVFPTLSREFGKNREWRLTVPCKAVGVVEQLKRRGYELDPSDARTIMKFFSKHRWIEMSVNFKKHWPSEKI